ncbi:sterol desaturase family protein [Litorimonas sp. RW-G-Af-16]|uniref:sterol desaturase family protein n=1 Tax=Litorimonas sp. RW-G-Af-16 TaxID=3241168 RepID=UPI00390CA710
MIGAVAIVLGSVIFMEVFAWAFHKYYMHGPGWGWHESHHVHTDGPFETNDLYAVCFSVIAAGLFILGSLWWQPLWLVALGFTIYGVLYGIVHDGLVHQRWPFRVQAKRGYLKRLVHSHRLHHAVRDKDGAVSFGFLYAPNPERLKATLLQRKTLLKEERADIQTAFEE